MPTIDINADLGEGYGAYTLGDDTALLAAVTSANIACGYHAGDADIMARTCAGAAQEGVAIGAHPGLPDLAGFGRREMAIGAESAYHIVLHQIGAMAAFAVRFGHGLHHVKPHGALYHMAERDAALSDAIARAVFDFDHCLYLYGMSGGRLVAAGRTLGLNVVNEVFADRTYCSDGTLTPRGAADSHVDDPAAVADRMVRLIQDGHIETVDGVQIAIEVETICVHGDQPGAAERARFLREALTSRGIIVTAPGTGS